MEIFKNYWDEAKSWDLKRQFIISHVVSKATNRHRPSDGSRGNQRKQTILYNFDIGGEKIDVCKVFFLNTLGISETVVRNALKKRLEGGFISADMRGRHTPTNKLREDVLNRVRAHINSFPIYESHYSREKTSKKYLGSDLNKEKMYQLYKDKCSTDGVPQNEIVKLWAYRRVFDTEFNLGFKTPSADTCDSCDSFILELKRNTLDEIEKQEKRRAYDQHLQDAGNRYHLKKQDKNMSKESEHTKVIMVDLQKCLPTPYLSNSQSFYLLKLWTLNLTIYDATQNKSYCMVWDECTAGRGGNEIVSALLKWATNVLGQSSIETLIIWSDNCPSQNRNIMMMTSYFWLLNVCPSLKTVVHKFLLRGHTHQEADHVHGLIERAVKRQPTMQIVTTWDWEQLIRSSGATVIRMRVEDFKNFGVLYAQPGSTFVHKKQNTDKQNFLISSVVWMEARTDSPGIVFYKTSFTEETFKTVNLNRSVRKIINLPPQLPPLRNRPKGIPQKKHDHLLTLLKWVPEQFHPFYRNMPVIGGNASDEDDSE